MDERIKQILVIICDNRLVCIDNTLTGLHAAFKKIEKKSPAYITLFRKMQPEGYFTLAIDNKIYHFEKFVLKP